MITWRRAPVACLCGGCGATIASGEPERLSVITYGSEPTRITKRRGVCCAGSAPPDLPPLVERTPITSSFLSRLVSSSPDQLPLDWKARSTGDRDPGEEG